MDRGGSKRMGPQRRGTFYSPADPLLLGLAITCQLVLRVGLAWYGPWLRAWSAIAPRPPDGVTPTAGAPLPLDTARCAANLPWCAVCREATIIPFPRRAGAARRMRRTGTAKRSQPTAGGAGASPRPLSSRESG
jgi:hypothetical protein